MSAVLKIDPEFESICPVLTDEEYRQLEENILSEGIILMPLIVWDGTIIDGHNRYKIAQAHPDIDFRTHEKHFPNRYEALSWICKNQLGRRNLTPQDKKYLVGKRYDAEKHVNGGDRKSEKVKSVGQNDPLISAHITRSKVAKETGTSESYVKHADSFAKGVDAAEAILPGIKHEILSGTIKPSAKDVAAIAKAPEEERRQKAEELRAFKEKAPAKSSRKAAREELQAIRKIAADMRPDNPPAPTSEDSVLDTLHGTVTDMIHICNNLFSDFPRLLADSTYKVKVIEIMQEPKQYILELEGEIK